MLREWKIAKCAQCKRVLRILLIVVLDDNDVARI